MKKLLLLLVGTGLLFSTVSFARPDEKEKGKQEETKKEKKKKKKKSTEEQPK